MNKEPLLQVKDLSIGFHTEKGQLIEIIDKVSFDIYPGEFFGLAGESGCGKTVTALSLIKLLPQPRGRIISGSIQLDGNEISSLALDDLYKVRGKRIGMIFQEPASAFNPLLTMKRQLMEVFDYHEFDGSPIQRINSLLQRVGFSDPDRILKAYPHELSGGMLQRVGICLALLLKPRLVIADEPTTALDVTVQAQILELLLELQKQEETAIFFISHNLNLIAQYADRVAIMYAGRIIETADVKTFFNHPVHPYSQGLLKALPRLQSDGFDLVPIPGQVPKPVDFPNGCRFIDRCAKAFEPCSEKPSAFQTGEAHYVNCFLYEN